MVWIFVSSHSSDCNHHMSSALFLLLMSGCLIMLSGSITPVSLALPARSPDKTKQRGSMTDCTTAIWGSWWWKHKIRWWIHMWRDAKTNAHSLKYRLFRGEHECWQGLYRTSAGVVFGPKKRDAIADHSFFKGRQWLSDSYSCFLKLTYNNNCFFKHVVPFCVNNLCCQVVSDNAHFSFIQFFTESIIYRARLSI